MTVFYGARDLLDDPPRRSRFLRNLATWALLLPATVAGAALAAEIATPLLALAIGVTPP